MVVFDEVFIYDPTFISFSYFYSYLSFSAPRTSGWVFGQTFFFGGFAFENSSKIFLKTSRSSMEPSRSPIVQFWCIKAWHCFIGPHQRPICGRHKGRMVEIAWFIALKLSSEIGLGELLRTSCSKWYDAFLTNVIFQWIYITHHAHITKYIKLVIVFYKISLTVKCYLI